MVQRIKIYGIMIALMLHLSNIVANMEQCYLNLEQ